MQVPVYGSSAYKYERESYAKPVRKVVKKVRVRKKNKTAMRGMILLGISVLAAFGILLTNSQILEKNAQIEEMQKKLDTVNAQVVSGQFAIERGMDLGKIEEEAMGRLGMQRPTKAQTVYVDLGNHDYAETVAPKEEKKGLFMLIADNLLEYFG
ncbi:MAG: hypothetical protein IJN74_06110 [Clostridia bacterium]|nr:hypothetical protein [Clostridia bacterium]